MWVIEKGNKLLSGIFSEPLQFTATNPRDAYVFSINQVARDIADNNGAILREVHKPRAPFGDYVFKNEADLYRVELELRAGGFQLLSGGANGRLTWTKATAKKHAAKVNALISENKNPWRKYRRARVVENTPIGGMNNV